MANFMDSDPDIKIMFDMFLSRGIHMSLDLEKTPAYRPCSPIYELTKDRKYLCNLSCTYIEWTLFSSGWEETQTYKRTFDKLMSMVEFVCEVAKDIHYHFPSEHKWEYQTGCRIMNSMQNICNAFEQAGYAIKYPAGHPLKMERDATMYVYHDGKPICMLSNSQKYRQAFTQIFEDTLLEFSRHGSQVAAAIELLSQRT